MYQDQGFAGQVPVSFRFCGYDLMVPSKHPLIGFHTPNSNIYQPYRDCGLGIIATALTQLGRQGVAIDIGANVGDTLAVIASNSDLKVICVEASDFFVQYLRVNVDRHFKDRADIRHSFVAAKPDDRGQALLHWGGTGPKLDDPKYFQSLSVRRVCLRRSTKRLRGSSALVKDQREYTERRVADVVSAGVVHDRQLGWIPRSNSTALRPSVHCTHPSHGSSRC